jgi:hypothetical protein
MLIGAGHDKLGLALGAGLDGSGSHWEIGGEFDSRCPYDFKFLNSRLL